MIEGWSSSPISLETAAQAMPNAQEVWELLADMFGSVYH
jgi:hypothetical protein